MILGKSLYDRLPAPRLLAGRAAYAARVLGALLAGRLRPGTGGSWFPSLVKEGGAFLCDACGLCADVCPSRCIEVSEAPGGGALGGFRLDVLRCVQCRLCERVCPRDAIVPSPVPAERLLAGGPLDKDDLACARPPS